MRVIARKQMASGSLTPEEMKTNACRRIAIVQTDMIDLAYQLDRLSDVVRGFGSGAMSSDMHRAMEELEGVRHEINELNAQVGC